MLKHLLYSEGDSSSNLGGCTKKIKMEINTDIGIIEIKKVSDLKKYNRLLLNYSSHDIIIDINSLSKELKESNINLLSNVYIKRAPYKDPDFVLKAYNDLFEYHHIIKSLPKKSDTNFNETIYLITYRLWMTLIEMNDWIKTSNLDIPIIDKE